MNTSSSIFPPCFAVAFHVSLRSLVWADPCYHPQTPALLTPGKSTQSPRTHLASPNNQLCRPIGRLAACTSVQRTSPMSPLCGKPVPMATTTVFECGAAEACICPLHDVSLVDVGVVAGEGGSCSCLSASSRSRGNGPPRRESLESRMR